MNNAERYGPQWRTVVTVIESVRTATPEQVKTLAAARDGRGAAYQAAAWAAAGEAAWDVAYAALDAARAAAWAAARASARASAGDAARAAVLHGLVGQHGYTAEHEAMLIGSYAAVFGLPWEEEQSLWADAEPVG